MAECVLCAFPDHLCRRLNQGTLACDIAGGRRGEIRKESRRHASDIFCAISLREQHAAGRVSIQASMIIPVNAADVARLYSEHFEDDDALEFDETHKAYVALRRTRIFGLELSRERGGGFPKALAAKRLAADIIEGRLKLRKWDDGVESLLMRVNFLSRHAPQLGYPFIDDEYKAALFEEMCYGLSSYSQVRDIDVKRVVLDSLGAALHSALDFYAPECVDFPMRKKPVQIRYEISTGRPVVSAWFKDLMGFDASKIRIADGAIAPTFEVLAPNGRPVQTTQDLEEFWRSSWIPIAKELKARYPKHFKDAGRSRPGAP